MEYWLYVTKGEIALDAAQFNDAVDHSQQAYRAGAMLNAKRHFPNYFLDLQEIALQQHYIEGVKCVSQGDFLPAKTAFEQWLALRLINSRSFRAENIAIYAAVCDVLTRVIDDTATYNDWLSLESMLEQKYVARTTWALWDRLQLVRQLSSQAKGDKERRAAVLAELKKLSANWRLFIIGTVLIGEDRLAGLHRQVAYPSFLDVFAHLDATRKWQPIMRQTLKHLLLLMADYERLRYIFPPSDEQALPEIGHPPVATERMTLREIYDVAIVYLRRRDADRHFDRALARLPDFEEAIGRNDFYSTKSVLENILDVIRSRPHTIRVKSVKQDPVTGFVEEGLERRLFQITADRLWSLDPKVTTFEIAEKLQEGEYYYLRPKWNTRQCDRYRIRYEQFFRTRLPRWMTAFHDGLFSSRRVPSDRFERWILQFRETERLLACKLFDSLRVYDKGSIVDGWSNVYDRLPPSAHQSLASGRAIITRLGHGAKSGALNPFYFRQAMSRRPEYNRFYRDRASRLFRDISDFQTEEPPAAIVFLDDLIGTGGQAVDFLRWYFPKYEWIKTAKLYLAVLVGYQNAIENVRRTILELQPKCEIEIIVASSLRESDRAFSDSNPLWESQSERIEAEQWARNLGQEILKDHEGFKYDPVEDAVGWKDCQALVAFEHNIPSDTLPIFWANGRRGGERWNWLFERFD